MRLAAQWQRIEAELPADWSSARMRLAVRSEDGRPRAAALLAPLGPGIQGSGHIVLTVARDGSAAGPDRLQRALGQLDDEHIAAGLEIVAVVQAVAAVEREHPPFAIAWAREIAGLPEDWSDLYAEVGLLSTDYLDRAALLLAPVNPARDGGNVAFRFRCARRFGYGVSAQMAERCLQRLDEEEIRGDLRILRVLADTRPVATQGPVWYLGGRAV